MFLRNGGGQIVNTEYRVEFFIIEVDDLIVTTIVGQFFGHSVENRMVEAFVVRVAIDDCNHD